MATNWELGLKDFEQKHVFLVWLLLESAAHASGSTDFSSGARCSASGPHPTVLRVIHDASARDKVSGWLSTCNVRVWANWHKRDLGDKAVSCSFRLKRDGHATNLRTVRSSGLKPIDKRALEIVRSAAPFRPPGSRFDYQKDVLVAFSKYPNLQVTQAD